MTNNGNCFENSGNFGENYFLMKQELFEITKLVLFDADGGNGGRKKLKVMLNFHLRFLI